MRKCMNILSVLFSFLEAALKRRPTTTEAELKKIMSSQLKMHLAVYGGGRTIIET